MTKKQEVIAALVAAFPDYPVPSDDEIVGPLRSRNSERREVFEAFRGKTWRQVSVAQVAAFKDALPLFTPKAFRYFLPAYLIGYILDPEQVDTAWDSIVYLLTPPRKNSVYSLAYFNEKVGDFSRDQVESLVVFFEYAARGERDPLDWMGDEAKGGRSNVVLEYWKSRR